MLTGREKVRLRLRINQEGFDYAIAFYESFDWVNDDEFHRLKFEYLAHRAKFLDWFMAQGIDVRDHMKSSHLRSYGG